ncbi:BcsE family c-di-GMP-binding protein, partial [Escherichia coli]|uniref:BcsE family c-di-GMP-binding protein n=1 Tax=Escherichia coli TaxID=562 RepID=UPI0022AC17D4
CNPTSSKFIHTWLRFGEIMRGSLSAELVQMRLLAPEQWGMPLPLTQGSKPVINAEHDGRHWRRIPEPMRLLDDAVERSS